jgi:hypothetical protein
MAIAVTPANLQIVVTGAGGTSVACGDYLPGRPMWRPDLMRG